MSKDCSSTTNKARNCKSMRTLIIFRDQYPDKMALMVKDMEHARKVFRFGDDPDVKLIDCDVKQPHEITRKF